MKILFFFANAIIKSNGGVENVTYFWYNYFKNKGHKVYILYWKNDSTKSILLPQVQLPNQKKCYSSENIKFFNEYVISNNIDIIINQSGLNNRTSAICTDGRIGTSAKLISIIHNTPLYFLKSYSFLATIENIRFLKNIIRWALGIATRRLYHYNGYYQYLNSDAIVVLAQNYITEYSLLNTGKKYSPKIYSISNPITFDFPQEKSNKENVALYVGRLTHAKGLERLIEAWGSIQHKLCSWKLYIIGDGPQKQILEAIVLKRNITNVVFIGNTNPIPYYKKAKIFCMTSRYEGFPMTLIECQYFGVVPIIMNSYTAASNIIKHGYNGILTTESVKKYSIALYNLMNDDVKLHTMSQNCYVDVKKYNPEYIYNQFITLFKGLIQTKSE